MMTDQINKTKEVILNTYSKFPVVFEKGEGNYLIDTDGNKYLDFVAGIAVNAFGYKNEDIINAINEVVQNGVLHTSNLYWHPYELKAASKLIELSKLKKAFYCNSGAEANEAALKLARKFGSKDNRYKIISMEHSFHGRTYGAVTATGQDKYHKNFFPLLEGIEYATFNDLESVEKLIDDKCCAIIVEPLQGEGGIIPATQEFLSGLRELSDKHNLLLIFDEVQCGMGRCGKPFCHQLYGVKPDVLTLAKALGGGIPCGAMVVGEKGEDVFAPGDHASTFGGNLVALNVSSVVLEKLANEDFMNSVSEKGKLLTEGLNKLIEKYPDKLVSTRGLGLMQGLIVKCNPVDIINACLKEKLLVVRAASDVVRFVPPLTIQKDEIIKMLKILDNVIDKL
ncbi:MAG: aspartate aminotransferase family protein [Pleomorphochaeta sp.]